MDAAAKITTINVAIKTQKTESNIICPNQRPIGSARPFDSCIACTADRRSLETYKEKNAGKTAYTAVSIITYGW